MSAIHPATDSDPLGADALASYLDRIGVEPPVAADLPTLRRIATAHPTTIPFENLDAFTGREPGLSGTELVGKLVHGGRGGWCFEHTGLLRRALDALGYRTTAVLARVRWGGPQDAPPTARTHMAVRVEVPEGPHLVDVGFGGMVPTGVLRLADGVEQTTPLEPYRLLVDPAGEVPEWTMQARVGGTWRTLYVFDMSPAEQIDVQVGSFYLSHHPDSPFRTGLVAARPGPDRRTNLAGSRLTVHHVDGPSETTDLPTPSAVRDALEDLYGIDTAGVEGLDARLATLFDG